MYNFSWDIPWMQKWLTQQDNYREKNYKAVHKEMFSDLLKGIMLWTQGWDWLLAEVDWENYGKREAWTNQALEDEVVRIWNERGLKILYSFNNSSLVRAVWWTEHYKHFISQQGQYGIPCSTRTNTEYQKALSGTASCQSQRIVFVFSFIFLLFLHFVGVNEFKYFPNRGMA